MQNDEEKMNLCQSEGGHNDDDETVQDRIYKCCQYAIKIHNSTLFEKLYQTISHNDIHSSNLFQEACRVGCIATMDLLIKSGLKVNNDYPGLAEDDSASPLLLAVENGNANIVKYLCSLPEIDKNAANKYGKTSIMVAANKENSVCLDALISGGCDVTAVDKSGNTALHHVCYPLKRSNKALQCMKLLINAGCDINARNHYGDTAVHAAQVRLHYHLVQFLISKNCIVGPNDFRDVPCLKSLCSGKTYSIIRQGSLYYFNGFTWCCQGTVTKNDNSNLINSRKSSVAFQSLKDACRFEIRTLLGTNIAEKVSKLGVPHIIQDYILLKDILPDNCFIG
ncbi:ankyrin repeat and death domain-containing protein 1A isoform X2 [Patella vulgata]|uniref:ankyrin repeat and death domain-containing protein 1A isoform X2 n=1 Tax=Patella vulgata TaxID=6465 RepID=UPI00217F6CE3|nr:ankyrin repeat and death domain-containing protein 1A isoform X2 [Patella vulgata]